jgi:hypothetical protein
MTASGCYRIVLNRSTNPVSLGVICYHYTLGGRRADSSVSAPFLRGDRALKTLCYQLLAPVEHLNL